MFKFTVTGTGWRKTVTADDLQAAVEAAFPGEGETLKRVATAERSTIQLLRAGRRVATLTTNGPA